MTELICKDCGVVGSTKTFTKGSFLIEILLWLFLIFPGLIYSIWRLTTRRKICAYCDSKNVIPVDSPMGRKIMKQLS